MHHDVHVRRPAGVVAGEDGVELRRARLRVEGLRPAQPRAADIVRIGRGVGWAGVPAVDARGVGGPELDVDGGIDEGEAGGGVDDEEVEV